MAMEWSLRLVGPEDGPLVLAADVFDGPATALGTGAFLGKPGAADPRNILIIAEMSGAVVGFASGTVIDHPDKPSNLFIQELGVNEAAQRRGIARALVSAIRAEGRRRGCRQSWVLTETDNSPARATYAAAGGEATEGVVMYEWVEDAD